MPNAPARPAVWEPVTETGVRPPKRAQESKTPRSIPSRSIPAARRFCPSELLRLMALIREADRREGNLIRQGKGWIHIPAMGHEALAALTYHLGQQDQLFLYYRDRALMLGRGLSVDQLALDFFARATSTTGGRGMPVHCSAKRLNIFPPATPTASQCLPAVGAAWGMKLASAPDVVICTVGDASVRQGEFYEAVCLAVQEQLPVVFLVEDNAYGISTPTLGHQPFRLGIFTRELVARVNGREPLDVFEKGGEAIARARRGEGPTILWCALDRLTSHTNSDDHRVYRTTDEIEAMANRDPVQRLANRLIHAQLLTVEDWKTMQAETARRVDETYQQAERAAVPAGEHARTHLYGPAVEHEPISFQPAEPTTTMANAINQVLLSGLERYPRMVIFGEDIEDPKGGVFGFTKGLSTKHPGRVTNSPLAEATIIGTAVGLAATGYKPVFEIQFVDFMTPAFNQLTQQVATLRWRSSGDWSCPMVIYAPYGAYLPAGGTWHSQSNEGWWAHIPGLRVAVPSTPADAAGLFWAAFKDEDPSLILIPKHIMRVRMPVQRYEAIRWGQAAVRRQGRDVTMVAWGNCVKLAEQAARQLEGQGVSVEIIDLRTLVPCDWQTLAQSVTRTGRLVVITEDSVTCSFGQAILAEISSRQECFDQFHAAPQLVARADVHIPFSPVLESAVLPDVARVLEAVYTTLE